MAKILIIGVGSAGTNAICRMKKVGIPNADYIAINTDGYDLRKVVAETGIKCYDLCRIFEEKYGYIPIRFKFLAEQCEEEISAIIDSHLNKPKGE